MRSLYDTENCIILLQYNGLSCGIYDNHVASFAGHLYPGDAALVRSVYALLGGVIAGFLALFFGVLSAVGVSM